LAALWFREHVGFRFVLSAALITAGGATLVWVPGEVVGDRLGFCAVVAACLVWAVDNNFSQKLAVHDPVKIAQVKSIVAGGFNLFLGLTRGELRPTLSMTGAALALGMASYGASLVLYLRAVRAIGAARGAAYFATAPFIGAVAAVLVLSEPVSVAGGVAALLMVTGVVSLFRERHSHLHTHEELVHDHLHFHDEHHQHPHDGPAEEPHSHEHRHEPLTHDHPHLPDAHHRHRH
jgi:drug/metabolite transporter (DMT)-like permease